MLRTVQASPGSAISVLGQSGDVLEYRPEVVPQARWEQTQDGLRITAWKAQRLYNDRRWPNPVVLRITHARPGLAPPEVSTNAAEWDGSAGRARFRATLRSLGKAAAVEVFFQFRRRKAPTELYEEDETWNETPAVRLDRAAPFSAEESGLRRGETYEVRSVVKHPVITIYGDLKMLAVPGK